MTTFVAMLRGINVSGHNRVRMADLQELVGGLGHTDVSTYLQSGNVVFTSRKKRAAELAAGIEAAIDRDLGLDVRVLVRTAAELAAVVAANPYRRGGADLDKAYVTFLDAAPERQRAADVTPDIGAPDEFVIASTEVYLHCPNGYGRTKLNNAFWERKLRVVATTRNWKTVTALLDLATR